MNKPTTDELKVEQTHPETYQTLEEVVRAGAKKMLIAALEAEVEAYIQSHQGERDKKGHALVVRNGHSQERTIQCGAGTLQVKAPRVHDQRPATLNGFSYISNNPVKLTDPLGLCEYDPYDPYIDYDCWVLAREISDWEGGGYAEFSTWDYENLSAYAYATGVGTGIIPVAPSPWPNINVNAIQELKSVIIDSAKRHNDSSRSNLSDEAFAALIAAHLNRESRFGAITWKRLTLYDAMGDIATRFLNYNGSIGIANIKPDVAEQILRGEIPGILGCFDYAIFGSQIDPTQTENFRDQLVNELFDQELSIEYLAANIERGVDRAEFVGLEPSVFNLGNWLWRGVQDPDIMQRVLDEEGKDVYRHGVALTKDMQKAFEVLGFPFTYYNAYNPDEAKFIK